MICEERDTGTPHWGRYQVRIVGKSLFWILQRLLRRDKILISNQQKYVRELQLLKKRDYENQLCQGLFLEHRKLQIYSVIWKWEKNIHGSNRVSSGSPNINKKTRWVEVIIWDNLVWSRWFKVVTLPVLPVIIKIY